MKKKGQIWQTLIPWIIAVFVLVLTLILYFTLTDRGGEALKYIRDLIRFR